jgi:BirA family biotin operon repressor/biotin-[acetyl-CoA-carboxylase] ligase
MWSGVWDVRHFDEIDSTNSYLRGEARRGAPEGTVAVAGYQTAGRGRMDRRWEAPPGASLLLSVLFRPAFDPAELHLCTAAIALAAIEACRRVTGVDAALKWPNDVLVGEAKLAGILAEAEFGVAAGSAGEGPTSCAVVVGMGLNIDWPGPPGVGSTCLADLAPGSASGSASGSGSAPSLGRAPVDRFTLLEALLEALSVRRALLDSPAGRRAVAAEMRNCCATLGRRVQVALASETITGVAEAIDDAGHLVVRTPAGITTVSAGDVVHLRPA